MDSGTLVTLAAAVIGTGGVAGALAALRLVPSQRNTAAVTQAQGAAAEWKKLYDEMEQQRDYWRDRCLRCERAVGEPELRDPGAPPLT